MAVLPILQRGDGQSSDVLSRPANNVVSFDDSTRKIVRDLLDTMHTHRIAVGLAAPQIGVGLKIAVINLKTPDFEDIILINPTIVREFGKFDIKKESCMSLRDWRGPVKRRSKMEVAYQDIEGKNRTIESDGFLSRVIAHEIDHLSGILYADRVSPEHPLERVDFDDWEHKI